MKIRRVAALLIWSALPAWAGTLLEIEKLSAETRSVEHQYALASAARSADNPAPVAEALATAELLPGRSVPGAMTPPEVTAHRQWLAQRGDELYAKAMRALDAGDRKTAVKSYLLAVKCAAPVMARDDRGLRDLALGALRRTADQHPEKPALRFQVGYYSYLFGDLPGSVAALERYQAEEKDPYRRWRGHLWRERVSAEHQRALSDERAAAAAAAKARREADATAHSTDLPNSGAVDGDPDAGRKEEVRRQLAALDAEISELQERTKGEVYTKNGQLMVRTWNQKDVRAKLDELKARRAELQAQL